MQKTQPTKNILERLSIAQLNKMQEAAKETILKSENVFLLAPTGSGKTLGFLLPLAQILDPNLAGIQCLIISPTRELALQIESVWKKMGTGLKVNSCYGGHEMAIELRNFVNPPALLIGTPGRISEHIDKRNISTDHIKTLVLDEFDKSLDLGFEEEMSYIVRQLTVLQKRVMVSATTKVRIPDFLGDLQPKVLNFTIQEIDNQALTIKTVFSENKDKIDALCNLLSHIGAEPSIIFVNHREAAERTASLLNEAGIEAAYFHGGMEQPDRERILIQFRNGSIQYLVASDLAARGLDIPQVRHIIHYHLPLKKEDFMHRNGRTARQNVEGFAYILLNRNEPLPLYVNPAPPVLNLADTIQAPSHSLWGTLYISGGKKDKLNKVDIVGFLIKKGELQSQDIGLIEVKDFISYVGIKRTQLDTLLNNVQTQKIKGKKYKIAIAKGQ